MAKIGRNASCPCGSGKKYKHCCEQKELAMKEAKLPPGRFEYQAGSYGSPRRGFLPSIMCYKEINTDSWKEHFCLVKHDVVFDDEDKATALAEQHIAAAYEGGTPQDFALYLRHQGYKQVDDFRVIKD